MRPTVLKERYQCSTFTIAPGVRLTVSKTGIGASAGVGPARYGVHASGRRTISARSGIAGVTCSLRFLNRRRGRLTCTSTPAIAGPHPAWASIRAKSSALPRSGRPRCCSRLIRSETRDRRFSFHPTRRDRRPLGRAPAFIPRVPARGSTSLPVRPARHGSSEASRDRTATRPDDRASRPKAAPGAELSPPSRPKR